MALSRNRPKPPKGPKPSKMSKIEGNRGFLRNTQKSKILKKGQKPSILGIFRGIFRISQKGENPHFLRFSRKVTKHLKNDPFDGFRRIFVFHSFAISLFHKQRIPLNFFDRKASPNQKHEKKSPEVTSILSVYLRSKNTKNPLSPLENPKKSHFRKRIPIFPRWFFCKRRGKDADFFCTSFKKWLFDQKWPFLRIPQKGVFPRFWTLFGIPKKGRKRAISLDFGVFRPF